MNRYIVKVELAEGNPEYAPDEKLANGRECEGFLLLTLKDGKPDVCMIQNLTIIELSMLLTCGTDSDAASSIREASVIAEGMRKANEIRREYEKSRKARDFASFLKMMGNAIGTD